MKVLVTGANGFVGAPLCRHLSRIDGTKVVALVRDARSAPPDTEISLIDRINGQTDWSRALAGVDAVVHLAALVHQIDTQAGAQESYQSVNVDGTLNLARQAATAGVKRFVFLSSVKACGEGQAAPGMQPYSEASPCEPQDAYGRSKREAELGLLEIAEASAMEAVVLRPPLVYGPGVKANFFDLLRWVDRGLPLPFGAVENRRDFIFVDNLIDAIATTLVHPAAVGRTFFVSDGVRLSTPELIQRIAAALGRPARLVSVPPSWLRLLGLITGKRAAVDRLLGSLMVDDSAIRQITGWRPPCSLETGLQRTASWYLKGRRAHAETPR